jgi:protein-tyrosine-phosphatase
MQNTEIQPLHSILFLCGQNVIRSPIAEAIARDILPKNFFIASAGLEKGSSDAFVAAILHERGLSVPSSEPQSLEEITNSNFDVIVTLSRQAHEYGYDFVKTHSINVEYWPVDDPSLTIGNREQILESYRGVFNDLETRIKNRFLSA